MYSSCLVEARSENRFPTKAAIEIIAKLEWGEVACLFSMHNAISVLLFSCLAESATYVELCVARQHRDG